MVITRKLVLSRSLYQWADPVKGNVYTSTGIFIATVVGILSGSLIGIITEYYTGSGKKPVLEIARQSVTGAATNIISGLSVGMMSTALPILVIAFAIIVAFHFGGIIRNSNCSCWNVIYFRNSISR